jgi:hypothetical protein
VLIDGAAASHRRASPCSTSANAMLGRASQHGWEHTVAEIAGYMGHATTNSGAFRAKLAALRDYGLVSGRGESLEITPVGRKIALPETDEERLTALQEAFANTVFGPLYQESVKGRRSRSTASGGGL